jgi:DNA-binding response OmpR family regulator
VVFDEVQVDIERRVVIRRNQEIRFIPAEDNLLTFFLQNPDRPLSRDIILKLGMCLTPVATMGSVSWWKIIRGT